ATIAPQHVFASGGKIEQAPQHVPAAALERASVTMRPPQGKPVPARAMPGPAALGAPGQTGPVGRSPRQHTGGGGPLSGPPHAAPLPRPPDAAIGGHQPGQPTTTAALPTPGHPGEAPAHGGTAVLPPSQSFTGQRDHPTSSGATRPHTPAQVFHPPAQAF